MSTTTPSTPTTDKIKKKAHLPRNKKFFWMFFVLSALFLVLGGAILPVWESTNVPWKNFGNEFFSLIFFAVILIYIVGYLIKQIVRESKTAIKILTVFEAGFFFAIAIGSILQYFDSASIGGPGTIVGIAFWSRGFVYVVKAYLCKHEEGDKYPLWTLILSIGLITLGSIMIANDIFTTEHVIWIVSCTLILISLVFLFLGFISKPKVDKAQLALKREQQKLKKQEKELKKQEKLVEKTQKRTESLESKIAPSESLVPVESTDEE